MKLDDIIKKFEGDIEKGKRALITPIADNYHLEHTPFFEFRSSALSSLLMTFGKEHPYYTEFNTRCDNKFRDHAEAGIGILSAALSELKEGWLYSTKTIVAAEIFTDFIEMASYLADESYKDAAAVIAGSVLEEQLRQLCTKNSIDITYLDKQGNIKPKTADRMNNDLYSNKIYEVLDNKNITAWLDLRNNAAHGKYTAYNLELVKMMIWGIRDFITRKVKLS